MNEYLMAYVENGRLVISIGVETLAYSANESDLFNIFEPGDDDKPFRWVKKYKVTEPVLFAKEIVRLLQDENEIGGSMLTNLFDKATEEALNDGVEGFMPIDEEGNILEW